MRHRTRSLPVLPKASIAWQEMLKMIGALIQEPRRISQLNRTKILRFKLIEALNGGNKQPETRMCMSAGLAQFLQLSAV